MKKYRPASLKTVKTCSLHTRKSKVSVQSFSGIHKKGGSFSQFLSGLDQTANALLAELGSMSTGMSGRIEETTGRLIVEIGRRRGATSVLVTHDVEGALAICDRIALLDRGLLRFVGAPQQFQESGDPLVRAFAHRADAAALAARMEEP